MQNNQYNNQHEYSNLQKSDYHKGFNSGYDSGYKAAMQMQRKVSEDKSGSKVAIVIKCIIIGAIAWVIVLLLLGIVAFAIEELGDDTARSLEWCEDCYVDGDYRGLSNRVSMYATDDSRFDIYEEMVKGYDLYLECRQWVICKDEEVDGAQDMLNKKLAELKALETDSKFDSNKKIFAEYISEINGLK